MVDDMASQLGGPLAEFLADRIPKAARGGVKRFPRVPSEDFEQAMWLRVLARQDHFRKLFNAGSEGAIWSELHRAATKLGSEDDRYRRAQKAADSGYSVDDEGFYSTAILGMLTEVLVEAEFDVGAAVVSATQATDAAGVHINVSDPFNGTENYTAMLLDVSAAFHRCPRSTTDLLLTYYGVRQDDSSAGLLARQKLAESMGFTEENLRQRVHRALKRLQSEVGGETPWR